ncbi:MAG TPA: hypothetical protein VFJ76_09570 [Solirubrobacterales bacterium]|nr:hypothetical protein [Solirubrobacterales bacterium]
MADAGAQPKAEEQPDSGSKTGFRFEELGPLGTILAAVGSGIGALGVVAFFGAAILWVRMDRVGVPANEAIAVVPKSVLVTTGASFLVPSLLLAVVLLGALYLIDQFAGWLVDIFFLGDQKRRLKAARRNARRSRAEIDRVLETAERAAEHSSQLKATAQKAVAAGADPHAVRESSTEASAAVTEAQRAAGEIQPHAKEADDALAKAEAEIERERDLQAPKIESIKKAIRFITIVVVVLTAAAPGILLSVVGLQDAQLLRVVAVAIFLSVICLVVLASTSFPWFALAIVVVVCLLNSLVTYYRTTNDPKVEPAAVLRSNGAPVFGYFVAQTSDRIYLATHLPTGPLRLDAIPRAAVTDMAIGKDLKPNPATLRARRLARQMCVVARQRAKKEGTAATVSAKRETAQEPCTVADMRRLTGPPPGPGGGPPT